MLGYIINTDPRWFSFLFNNGIKNPVFWLKRANNPSSANITMGSPIFFRITGTNPPVIKGYGVVRNALIQPVNEAFLKYGNRLGYSTIEEMINVSKKWTSGVELESSTDIFFIEVGDFKIIEDIRTDTELADLGINFDYRHVVTGKGLNNSQTEILWGLVKTKEVQQVKSIVKFINDSIGSYVVNEFNPNGIQDAREFAARLIAKRRGQPEFRKNLLRAYESKCAITDCDAVSVLEAAHIIPYKGEETNHISNGLLLRADIHTLFDLCLIAIDSIHMKVIVHPSLMSTEYRYLMGKSISLPLNPEEWPSKVALDIHRAESNI